MGMEFYYHGYTHDIPSQFDYKKNVSGLESMNWETCEWTPMEREPAKRWIDLVD